MKRVLLLVGMLAGCDYVFRLDAVPEIPPRPDAAPIVGRWSQVAAGSSHTCAIDDGGTLYCWGRNDYGQTGTGSSAFQVPQMAVGTATWTKISTIDHTTCGIQSNGSLWCWGRNYTGMVGNGTADQADTPQMLDAGSWLDVDAGHTHSCAVKADHSLWCWGQNDYGQLGDGTLTTRLTPTQGGLVTTWDQVAAGDLATCAIATDRSLWCWGANNRGQIGNGTTTDAPDPVKIGTDAWKQVGVGDNFACGLTEAGELRCWGSNADGMLADGSTDSRSSPAPVPVGGQPRNDWREVAVGTRHACGRTEDGSMYCWGNSSRSQLGVTMDAVTQPLQIATTLPWQQIAAGGSHTCGIAVDHGLWCVGADGYGQLGDDGTSPTTPRMVPGTWQQVSAGVRHTCALDGSGAVWCAGDGGEGQLGTGIFRSRSTLTQAINATGYALIVAGHSHTCGIVNQQLWCWGANYRGQLGTGGMADTATPTQGRAAVTVAALQHTCAVNGAGTMTCSGENDSGQAGGTNIGGTVLTPTTISKTWQSVGVGRHHTCGIDTNKRVFCFGSQVAGTLGDGVTTDTLTATPQDTGMDAEQLSIGGYHTCARSVAVVKCWGGNYAGQLGFGGGAAQPVPQVLPGEWLTIGAGYEHTCGIKIDGSLWCWGSNRRGQLGIGTHIESQSPVRVGTDTGWASVSSGDGHSCATKSNQTMYCWGDNDEGQLGDGSGWRTELVQAP